MNLMTMFWAYREASGRCETYVLHRPQRNFGIAEHNDYDARRWQRYHRLERKLQRRIEADLADYDAQAERIAELEEALRRITGMRPVDALGSAFERAQTVAHIALRRKEA